VEKHAMTQFGIKTVTPNRREPVALTDPPARPRSGPHVKEGPLWL
jgi:hypothetical protein